MTKYIVTRNGEHLDEFDTLEAAELKRDDEQTLEINFKALGWIEEESEILIKEVS